VIVEGRLVIGDRIARGRITVEDGFIAAVDLDDGEGGEDREGRDDRVENRGSPSPYIVPGFVDVHVHGWGGHDAMGSTADLDGMARGLLRHGVTSFLPTAVTSPLATLSAFADRVRRWMPAAPEDGAVPLGFNLEGPFISSARTGAQNPDYVQDPVDAATPDLETLIDGLRLMTVAPELPGALGLIEWLRARGVAASMGHSAASLEEAQAGYAAGGRTTTHLFNAMTGVDHHVPGLAVAALTDDDAYVELIADGHHVHPAVWPIILRTKPSNRLILVSDAVSLAGIGDGRTLVGGLEVEVREGRCTLVSTGALAGSVIALDTAVRNLVENGASLPYAVAGASRNPLALLGVSDRGTIAVGQRADLVELDGDLTVRRVTRGRDWIKGAATPR
jgi:N-acetylglucosamine-6-phosphate deacetylase